MWWGHAIIHLRDYYVLIVKDKLDACEECLQKCTGSKMKRDDQCQRDWLKSVEPHQSSLPLNLKPLIKWLLRLTAAECWLCSRPCVALDLVFWLTVMHTQISLWPRYQSAKAKQSASTQKNKKKTKALWTLSDLFCFQKSYNAFRHAMQDLSVAVSKQADYYV